MVIELITLEVAAQRSGLHPNTIARLLRRGVLQGHKATQAGRCCWVVSVRSLRHYTDPISGELLYRPGPKVFLARQRAGVAYHQVPRHGRLKQETRW